MTELRKCECGGEPFIVHDTSTMDGDGRCFLQCKACRKWTEIFDKKDQAIQAWNEGKVE